MDGPEEKKKIECTRKRKAPVSTGIITVFH